MSTSTRKRPGSRPGAAPGKPVSVGFPAMMAIVAASAVVLSGCTPDLSHEANSASNPSPDATSGPLNGVFQVTLGPMTKDRAPFEAQTTIETWAMRSACTKGGCRATVSVIDPNRPADEPSRQFVLDEI